MDGFDEVLLELVTALRRGGLRISPAESMDALAAAAAVGLAEREDLRAALAASLAKSEGDRSVFDRTFDAFFHRGDAIDSGVADKLRASGASEGSVAELLRRAEMAQGAGGAGGGLTALLEGGAELERRIERALADARVSEITSPMQIGLFALRALDRLGVDRMERDLNALRAALADQGEIGERALDLAASALQALSRTVRARVRAAYERQNPDQLRRNRAERLEREALAALSKDEVDQVTAEVRKLGRTLRDRMERQRRRARRGRLDVRATVRASLRNGGIPFRPVFRRRRRERPKLVVLCDVSDSVRAAARFLLVLVYAMQEAFARTRSFVFVRDLGECTHLFEGKSAEEAIARAFSGEVISVAANSDYGRAFGQLAREHLAAIDHHTTVVILGDGRNNYLDSNTAALAAVQRRAARIIWLNPEPRGSWGFGDSEMQSYARWCAFADTVRSLGELRSAMERLASVITR
jgi:uncharacterized protein